MYRIIFASLFAFITFTVISSSSFAGDFYSTLRRTAPGFGVSQIVDSVLPDSVMESEAARDALIGGLGTATTVGVETAVASGATALAGYAGVASTVSSMGLGSLTTLGASLLGSSATGAAATAVCVSAVGGPVVAAGLLVGATALITYGASSLAREAWSYLGF